MAPAATVKGGITTVINGIEDSERFADCAIVRVASHVDGSRVRKAFVAMTGLGRAAGLLLGRRFDLVYLHTGDNPSPSRKYLFFRLAGLCGVNTVIHWHAASFMEQYPKLSGFWRRRIKRMLTAAGQVVCLSESWRDDLLKLAPAACVTVLPNAVRLPLLNDGRRPTTALRLTFLGLIGPRKGIWDLLESLKRLREAGFAVRLSVGGNGEVEKLAAEIERLGLAEAVDYLGWISAEERDRLLRVTDVYVLPSYGEGLPMSVLEAMSYAIPVVATTVGGLPELIVDGVNGFLVEPGDVDALTARLAELTLDASLRQDMGRSARQTVEAGYELDKYCIRLRQVLGQAAQNEMQGGLRNAAYKC
ncbi:MAG: putative glycosyltransferase EpsD [Deltaproteobacteria bacterium ADurb.Bin510]|nr:MAG: putative glycosyltransferase EpsD [Deltaproteobacteria bacterium ADurb.Bin510]